MKHRLLPILLVILFMTYLTGTKECNVSIDYSFVTYRYIDTSISQLRQMRERYRGKARVSLVGDRFILENLWQNNSMPWEDYQDFIKVMKRPVKSLTKRFKDPLTKMITDPIQLAKARANEYGYIRPDKSHYGAWWGYQWRKENKLDYDALRYFKRILQYPSWMLWLYSHSYAYQGAPPGYLTKDTIPEWCVESIYGLIYKFPAPRRWKTGPKTGIKLVGIGRTAWNRLKGHAKIIFCTWQFHGLPHDRTMLKVCWVNGKNAWKRRMVVIGIIFVLLGILVHPGFMFGSAIIGTTFYADNTLGLDTNDGLAPTDEGGGHGPIKSLEQIGHYIYYFNHVQAGDTMSLKCGETFKNQVNTYLDWRYYGNEGQRIILNSYDVGARPIIDTSYLTTPKENFHRGGHKEIRGIEFKGHAYNIQIIDFGVIADTGDTIIEDCKFDSSGNGTFGVLFSGSGSYSYMRFNEGCGLGHYAAGDDNLHYGYCYGNNCYDGEDNLLLHQNSSGTSVLGHNFYYHDNICETADEENFDIQSGNLIYNYDNEFKGDASGGLAHTGTAYDVVSYRNYLHDQDVRYTFIIGTKQVTAWGNLIVGTAAQREVTAITNETDSTSPFAPNQTKFYKNTVVYAGSTHFNRIIDSRLTGEVMGTNDIRYNIFTTVTAGLSTYVYNFNDARYKASDADFTCNFNLYGPNGTGSFTAHDTDGTYDWTGWRALGHDAQGKNTDPLFVDLVSFKLQETSPARGMGPGTDTYQPDRFGVTTDLDAGYAEYGGPPPPTYTINGEILVGGLPLVGVLVTDGSRNAYTGALGTFSILNVPDGTYNVTPSMPHYTFAPVSRSVTVSGADQNNIDYTATEDPKYSIKGTVLEGVTPLGGVNVSNGVGGSDLTDMVTGEYDIPDNYNGLYTVTPNMVGYTFTPPNRSVTVAGADNVGNDFAATGLPPSTGDLQIRNIIIQNIQMGN